MPGFHLPASLRLHLMAWLVLPVVAILGVSAWLSYGSAHRQATLLTDRQLIASARVIAEDITYESGSINVDVSPAALELFATDSHDEVAYSVIGPNQVLLAGFPGLSAPLPTPSDLGYRTFETTFRAERMRAVALTQPVVTPNGPVNIVVVVGETQKARRNMEQSLWIRGFIEQGGLVLAGALSIWVGINRELRPLLRLGEAVVARPADRFEPFDTQAVQTEIRPLVAALNSHMKRLDLQIRRQKQFLETAAHQLRTPLAVLKTQVGFARRTRDTLQGDAALADVDHSLTAMSRLTNQLLILGKVDHEHATLATEIVDLGDVARQVTAEMAPRALDAGVELVFETEGPCRVASTATLIQLIVANLVENVISHAGGSSVATISIGCDAQWGTLTVTDNGAGIEAVDREKLFERFRRGTTAGPGGSGLGLAIVAEIAEMLGGSAELPEPPDGKGFCTRVRLPLASA